ncbi:MAG: DinB family protein [Calditrichia bacterium]
MSKTVESDQPAISKANLQALYKHNRISRETVENLLANYTDEQLHWKPDEGTWSVSECLDHITNTSMAYLPNIKGALAKAEAKNMTSDAPMKAGLFARWFIKTVGPNSAMKLSAPGIFRPTVKRNPDFAEAFRTAHDEIQAMILAADKWNLNKPKLASPITSLLRFSIGEALWLQVAHTQRHLLQARRLTERADFPAK